jgi:AmmeMemoRadiSam system protein B
MASHRNRRPEDRHTSLMLREPVVAGKFYPADPSVLAAEVDGLLAPRPAKHVRAIACVVPHAGYMYSGAVAGAVYATLEAPACVLLVGPRHFPGGAPLAILCEGAWRTPLGDVPIDASLATAVRLACPILREDEQAHRREHSLEVQLPFLQRLKSEFTFVPVVLATDRYGAIEELGMAIAHVVREQAEQILIVASTDLNHYENQAITLEKDGKAIEKMLALDAPGLFHTVREEAITMCGCAATTAVIVAACALGASSAELVQHTTSAEVNGDTEHTVGYAGIIIR